MRLKWKLFVASLKMFSRQREALIWTLLLPLFMITLFGFVNFDGLGKVEIGIVNEAGGRSSRLLSSLEAIQTVRVTSGTRAELVVQLKKGERDLVLLIPESFGADVTNGEITALVSDAKPQEVQLGTLIIQRALDELAFEKSDAKGRVKLHTEQVVSRNLTYIDFLLPGILAMSIMQLGIFGVAFGFVSLKKRGILRRLWVTPIQPGDFVTAQVAMRLLVVMTQILVIVGVGIFFFNLNFVGNILELLIVGLIGAVLFLGIGFAIAGMSKSEDQVAPLANVITLPMLLLSGVFFSRSHLPGIVKTITGFFPLTYLADAMRAIAIDGASIFQLGPEMLGLGIWCVITFSLAIKFFRWE